MYTSCNQHILSVTMKECKIFHTPETLTESTHKQISPFLEAQKTHHAKVISTEKDEKVDGALKDKNPMTPCLRWQTSKAGQSTDHLTNCLAVTRAVDRAVSEKGL